MTQKIFDKDNEKDMADLWDILPDNINRVIRYSDKTYKFFEDEIFVFECCWLRINWHDATEITRPVDYESMIGCVGWFWDNEIDETYKRLGVLTGMEEGYYCDERVSRWTNFQPAKKSELKIWEDEE